MEPVTFSAFICSTIRSDKDHVQMALFDVPDTEGVTGHLKRHRGEKVRVTIEFLPAEAPDFEKQIDHSESRWGKAVPVSNVQKSIAAGQLALIGET